MEQLKTRVGEGVTPVIGVIVVFLLLAVISGPFMIWHMLKATPDRPLGPIITALRTPVSLLSVIFWTTGALYLVNAGLGGQTWGRGLIAWAISAVLSSSITFWFMHVGKT